MKKKSERAMIAALLGVKTRDVVLTPIPKRPDPICAICGNPKSAELHYSWRTLDRDHVFKEVAPVRPEGTGEG